MQVQICTVLDLFDWLALDYEYSVCNYLVCNIFCLDQQICLVKLFTAGLKSGLKDNLLLLSLFPLSSLPRTCYNDSKATGYGVNGLAFL